VRGQARAAGCRSKPTRHSSLGDQVNHLARLLAHALGARIAPLGVVPGQVAQLLALGDLAAAARDVNHAAARGARASG
jgi:hypothetical protein